MGRFCCSFGDVLNVGIPETQLAPGLLVATPQLRDGFFARSVVLLIEADSDGAVGFVVNRPTGVQIRDVAESIGYEGTSARSESIIRLGGPVEPQRGWLLAADRAGGAARAFDPAFELDTGLVVHTEIAVLQEFLDSEEAAEFMLTLGYSGWGAGQLEDELREGSWLPLDYDEALVFADGEPDDIWQRAMDRLGVGPMMNWSGSQGNA